MEDAVVKLVKQQVTDCLAYQYNLHSGGKEKLEKLKDALNKIEAVAEPAGGLDLESEKHKNLKAWMREIKVAAEEANDVLDEFEYLCLEHQDEVGEAGCLQPFIECPISFIRHGFFHSLYMYARRVIRATDRLQFILSTNLLEFFRSTNPLERLRSIQIKMDGLATRAEVFLELVRDAKADDREHHKLVGRKRETGSSVVEPELVRKDKLEEIINKLLLEEEPVSDRGSMGAFVPVLAMVGHGGMGKTTLAQHVLSHTRVKDHFKVRMWAYVSQHFDVPTITRRMIQSAAPKMTCSDTESLEALQQKLKGIIKSKKFLLVLDDVWYPNQRMEEEWKILCSPLVQAGAKGSKILLTSRQPGVERLCGVLTPLISLEGLTQEECWSIIQTIAYTKVPALVTIGREIAGRVCGSPLAAKAVGGALQKKLDSDHWSNILNSELSKLPENEIMPVLRLSYQYLPSHLRQCFAYCSLFPKGHYLNVDMLVRMWVAHGYIGDRLYGERTEEDTGRRYFDDLLSLGFFTRRIDDNGIEKVFMHDLMNDLSQFVSKDEFLLIEYTLPQDGLIPETIQHLSVLSIDYLAELINKNKKSILSNLKTFLFVPEDFCDLYDDEEGHVKELLKLLRRVRVLDIRWVKTELPDDIGGWVHLRYLNVSSDSLPEWLWRLYYLQVLIINTYSTASSTEKLCNLVRLRYLKFYRNLTLAEIRVVKSLQVLYGFLHVESGRGSDIGNLKPLNELQGRLELTGLNNVESGDAAREADLCGKQRLQNLVLKWNSRSSDPDVNVAAEVLNGVQPHSSLEELQITYYPGMACPKWMGDPSFKKLYYITLDKLLQLECLPPLEQLPSLKILELSLLPRIRKLSHKEFPSLIMLSIRRMEELEDWIWSGGLPCLEDLTITDCPKLRKLPTLSPTVMRLEIRNVGISSLPGIYEKCVDQRIESSSSSSVISSSSSKLSFLHIAKCGSLKSLGEGLLQNQHRLRHLDQVFILDCEQLISIPDEGFRELSLLRVLEIYNCPNLTWASQNQEQYRILLPPSMVSLKISHLGDETLSGILHGHNNLSKLNIWRCPCLISMPSREVLAHLTSLQQLSIYNCPSLIPSALDDLQALPSLKMLRIRKCPGLLLETSSISTADDGEGMSRASFSIAVERLQIDDPLMLTKVPFLKSLASVQKVEIYDASGLISFYPELEEWLLQNDTSLRELKIKKAGQLQTLPNLPKTLKKLEIYDANEEFMKRYESDIGPDWDKIRHIEEIVLERY